MANTDRPNGMHPTSGIGGYTSQAREYVVVGGDATDIARGDPVKSTGTGDSEGRPGVTLAAPGDVAVGVCVGFKVDRAVPLTEHPGYKAANESADVVVLVNDDPDTVYEIQADGATGAVAMGNTADWVNGGVSSTTGMSSVELDSSDIGTGAGLRILGAVQVEGNDITSDNARLLVKFNEHEFRGAGTGV